ncbi:MAG TPA: ABC transporter permease [Micromonosporaceae bacterium]|jgi:ABC-2 type transport system permease protein
MRISGRRVRAIFRKELREYRRKTSVVVAMATIPLLYIVQPLVSVFALPASASGQLRHEHVLLYVLGIPALVPVLIAAFAVVGEREQGTLEPVLTTPVRREELVLGKALAALLPSVGVAYAVFAIFIGCVRVFAEPTVASSLLQWSQILAQLVFTPLIAAWSIWIGMFISTKASDLRVAQQLGVLASLPTVIVAVLIALNVIHPSLAVALRFALLLLVLDTVGWRVVSAAFDRERLITGTR